MNPVILRHEIKTALKFPQANLVFEWLRFHPAAFRKAFPNRVVHNIYFDTPDLHAYQDNLHGIGTRRKLRLRWYDSPTPTSRAVLEAKNKRGILGWKNSECLNLDGRKIPLNLSATKKLLPLITNQRLKLLVENLSPTLLNNYTRQYYVDATNKVRITVDTDLSFSPPIRLTEPNKQIAMQGTTIIEFKFAAEDAEDASMILGTLPFRRGKFSKYVTGIQLTRGLR